MVNVIKYAPELKNTRKSMLFKCSPLFPHASAKFDLFSESRRVLFAAGSPPFSEVADSEGRVLEPSDEAYFDLRYTADRVDEVPQRILGALYNRMATFSLEEHEHDFEEQMEELFAWAHQAYSLCSSFIRVLRDDGQPVDRLECLFNELTDFLCMETIFGADNYVAMRESYERADLLAKLIETGGFDEQRHFELAQNIRGEYSYIFVQALMARVNSRVGNEAGFLYGRDLFESLQAELDFLVADGDEDDGDLAGSSTEMLLAEFLSAAEAASIHDELNRDADWGLISGGPITEEEEPVSHDKLLDLRLYRYFERHGALRPALSDLKSHMMRRLVSDVAATSSPPVRNGGIRQAVVSLADRIRKMEGRMKGLELDPLTRLPKREIWDETIGKLRGRRNEPYTLVFIDFVGFTRFNFDVRLGRMKEGHKVGDQGLSMAARALASVPLRDGDLLARWGGEEFGLLLRGDIPREAIIRKLKEYDDALELVNRKSSFVYKPGHPQAGQKVELAASFGVERFDDSLHDGNPDDVWEGADVAMYANKFHPGTTLKRSFEDRRAIAFGQGYGGGRFNFDGESILESEQLRSITSFVSTAGKAAIRGVLGENRYENGTVMNTGRRIRGRFRKFLS